ncbi:MAG: hypothetical protein WC849_02880 [Candidatus Paceibacterota bacterium]
MKKDILDYLSDFAKKHSDANTAPQVELLRFFKKIIPSATKVGILPEELKNSHFNKNVTCVIFIIKEKERNGFKCTFEGCICIVLDKVGSISYELHPRITDFLPYWESKKKTSLFGLLKVSSELNYFLKNGKPLDEKRCKFLDGDNITQRLHEEIRDLQLEKEIMKTFDFTS